jgi:hypothetical protein
MYQNYCTENGDYLQETKMETNEEFEPNIGKLYRTVEN